MTQSSFITEYKFDLVRNYAKAVIVINLLLFLVLATRGWDYIIANPYTFFSLGSSILVFIAVMIYDWRSSKINLGIILFYVFIVGYEFLYFGIPKNVVDLASRSTSKGLLMDMFLMLLPHLYFGLRCAAVFCLLPVWWQARNFSD